MKITQVLTEEEIQNCFAVLSQLRTHLAKQHFVEQVKIQMQEGYRLVCILESNDVITIAGYRILHNLAWGKFMYIDDLITDSRKRSQGAGKLLMQWLVKEARRLGCGQLHLDTGLQRIDAQRFYDREGLEKGGFHYMLVLD